MKIAIASLVLLSSLTLPAQAGGPRYRNVGEISNRQAYNSQGGYAYQEKCFRKVYREKYVPGTMNRPGYVTSYKERVRVPCNREPNFDRYDHKHYHKHYPKQTPKDDNSCIEGAVLGGIGGAGAGAALSRGDGRWWAIPLGIVGGSMVGCQIDGG